MRRVLLLAALAAGGVAGSAGGAGAQQPTHFGPSATSVTWPSATPPGWYTNTYNHAWYNPWYAYYDFSSGPYANWMAGGGFATYAHHGPAGHFYYPREVAQPYLGVWWRGDGVPGLAVPGVAAPKNVKTEDKKEEKKEEKKGTDKEKTEARLTVTLPADATLLFNGTAATGTGSVRTFRTPALQAGQIYRYELTAEVVRDGRTERVTESVVVRAGETSAVTLVPMGVTTAGAK